MVLGNTWTPRLPSCVPCPARRNTSHLLTTAAPRPATLPMDSYTVPRVGINAGILLTRCATCATCTTCVGTFLGAPPREAFLMAREPHPGPCLTFPGTPCRELCGNLPRHALPGALPPLPRHALPGALFGAFASGTPQRTYPTCPDNSDLAHASRSLGTPGTRRSTVAPGRGPATSFPRATGQPAPGCRSPGRQFQATPSQRVGPENP